MIQADDRRGLGEAVALNHARSRGVPQNSSSAGSSGAAPTTKLQNFQPNARWTRGIATTAAGSARRRGGISAAMRRHAQDVLAQHVEDLRHRHQHRDPARLDLADDVVRVVAADEQHRPGQHRRDEGGHRLAEHVRQRQQVQEPDRDERPRVTCGTSGSRARPGTMLASTLRWVMTTPLGSAVAPDVKMISAVSSRVTRRPLDGARARSNPAGQAPDVGARARRSEDASTSSPISTSRDLTIAATRCRKSAEAR